ncbi:DUF6776 family protein [Parendozoicomonas haliclonae]|uniref:Uncharacterized protein n=1 Tax=Parendozoicomonas haliclonae TaxID=1960125 RepID=A0A1X7API4_9GAMM|nr:DUF6776 family protein [Parendozoicomonas haliclonae]SMA50018.1 hypothetical protein EHSB41UT_03809 [Parendozoicomonas haliclonae]
MKNWFRGGSKQTASAANGGKRLLVVHHDPSHQLRIKLLVGLLFVGAAITCFYLGITFATKELTILRSELASTKAENGTHLQELDQLQRKVAILERGAWVSREAAEEIRLELVKLREEKSILSRDLRFYRGIMEPKSDQGVSVQSFELLATPVPRKFQWKIVVVQNAKEHKQQRGTLQTRIDGFQDGKKVSYTLGQLSGMKGKNGQSLGFQYFQRLPGDSAWGTLELPEGFEPEAMEVSIQLTSPSRKVIKKTFEWFVEESD